MAVTKVYTKQALRFKWIDIRNTPPSCNHDSCYPTNVICNDFYTKDPETGKTTILGKLVSEANILSTEKAEIKVDFYGLKLVIVASVYAILSILAMIALCLCKN